MLKLWKKSSLPSHEHLFVKHYKQMFKGALVLTNNDYQRAEDLVHDVFIQFKLAQPNLEEIENLDGYLFTMLRNLIRSKARRKASGFAKVVAIEEYETVEIGLRLVDLNNQLNAREDLRSICSFLCERKESSKSASVLILRYFLGYFRSEIKQITKNSQGAVDFLINMACRESRLYLEKPHTLGFVQKPKLKLVKDKVKTVAENISSANLEKSEVSIEDFVRELSKEIFKSCQGECFTKEEFSEIYDESNRKKIKAKRLAHLVSCVICLEEINEKLGLPLLKDRFPTDTLNRKPPATGGGNGSGDDGTVPPEGEKDGEQALKTYRRKLKEIEEYEPRELLVAVNGQELGTLKVNSKVSELKFKIEDIEDLKFIEIFGEQDHQLFFMLADPPPIGLFEKKNVVSLSRNRNLSVELEFSESGADLQVIYNHPEFVADLESSKEILRELNEDEIAYQNEDKHGVSEKNEKPLFGSVMDSKGISSWFNLKFALPTGAIAVLLIAALIFIQIPQTKVSAAELLNRSTKTELEISSNVALATHRSFNLEQRTSEGVLIERRRLEVWQSKAKGLKIRRIYDEENRLIIADWQRADGLRTIYRPGDAPLQMDVSESIKLPKDLNDAWELELTAKDFTSLVRNVENVEVVEKENAYILKFDNKNKKASLVKAELTLNRKDFRATEKTIITRSNEGTTEFRFVESAFEQPKIEDVPESVFEPESELIPQIIEEPKAKVEESPSPEEETDSTEETESQKEIKQEVPEKKKVEIKKVSEASTDLEIEVLSRLDRIGATLGQEVTVNRLPEGILEIEGIVSGEKRKQQILNSLKSVRNNSAVRIRIETPEEAQARISKKRRKTTKNPRIQIQDVKPSSATIPMDSDLRNHFKNQGISGDKLDSEINRFAKQMIMISRSAKLHTWSLRDYSKRFSSKTVNELSVGAKKKWFSVIAGQSREFRQKVSQLSVKLASIGNRMGGKPRSSVKIEGFDSLKIAINRLNKLNNSIDRAVRESFTLSGKKPAPIKSQSFWSDVAESIALARAIEQGAKRLENYKKK